MDIKAALLHWLRRFSMIHGFFMTIVWLVSAITSPDMTVDVRFLGNMLLVTLTGTIPGLIYMSKEELTDKQWWIRTLIHYVLLNIMVLPLTRALGLWQDTRGMIAYAVIILVVDILVHVVMFGADWLAAMDINRELARRRNESDD